MIGMSCDEWSPNLKHEHTHGFARRLSLLGVVLLAAIAPALAQSASDNATKLVELLKECGYDYRTTKSPTVWSVHFNGKHLKDVKVILAVNETLLVTFVTVVEKRRMPITVDFRGALLDYNHQYDRVKVLFDGDGDLSVRIDSSTRILDAGELRTVIEQVESASDEIYGKVEPKLLP